MKNRTRLVFWTVFLVLAVAGASALMTHRPPRIETIGISHPTPGTTLLRIPVVNSNCPGYVTVKINGRVVTNGYQLCRAYYRLNPIPTYTFPLPVGSVVVSATLQPLDGSAPVTTSRRICW